MKIIADFHIHSKFSISTSKEMEIPILAEYAKRKGITLIGTGDFTHPVWLVELEKHLQETGTGLYTHKGTHFILTAEVSTIFYVQGRAKRIHIILFAPSLETVRKINKKLIHYGALLSDGRPQLHLSACDLVKMLLDISPDCFLVPAHVWTPHFSLFGANSGFDTIEECFADQTEHIYALETGLSSDPAMNWQWSALDKFTLISNSDAHSPIKLGREANILNTELDYFKIINALKNKDANKMLGTIEFFPQEGKYHWDGHRACNVSLPPAETLANKKICPVCRRPLTIGVLHRVTALGDRPAGTTPKNAVSYHSLIPLPEIMAQAWGKQANSAAIKNEFIRLTSMVGTEFQILMDLDQADLYRKLPRELAAAILKVRQGKVNISPGYDGVFGKVEIPQEIEAEKTEQLQLF